MKKIIFLKFLMLLISTNALAKEKELKICYENWYPYIETVKGGAKGISVDIVENALKPMGYKFTWVEMVAKRCYLEVENGRFDMTLNVSFLEDKKWIQSKTIILDWELAAIVGKSEPLEKFESLNQFKGKIVGMTRGYVYPDNIANDLKSFKIDEVADAETNLAKLALGRIGLLIEDPLWAEKIAKRDNLAIKVLSPSIALDPTYVVFTPKLADLAKAYDEKVISMAHSGEIDKIYVKAIGKPYSGTGRIKALKKP
jgi:polar amino acid transport system substrate-binding protein